MTVTYQVGEGGHLDIDFWVRKTFCIMSRPLLTYSPVVRPIWNRSWETNTAIHWFNIHYCSKGWSARVLLLQPNECYCRQDG